MVSKMYDVLHRRANKWKTTYLSALRIFSGDKGMTRKKILSTFFVYPIKVAVVVVFVKVDATLIQFFPVGVCRPLSFSRRNGP